MKFITLPALILFITSLNLSAQNGLSIDAYITAHQKTVVIFDLIKFNRDLNRYVKNVNKKVVSTALIRNMRFFEPFYTGSNSTNNSVGSLFDYLISYQLGSPDSWLRNKLLPASKNTDKHKDYSKSWGN